MLGVGPARAGMIRDMRNQRKGITGWPRTSGDDPHHTNKPKKEEELAPHERG